MALVTPITYSSEISEPKHVEVTARIIEKDYLRGRGIFERTLFVFWLDNGDSIGVSQVDYLDYEIGDTYTYCTCQVMRL